MITRQLKTYKKKDASHKKSFIDFKNSNLLLFSWINADRIFPKLKKAIICEEKKSALLCVP